IIHVDQYTLPNGDVLFRLPTGEGVLISGEVINKLDKNAVESTLDSATPLTDAEIKQFEVSHTPTLPLTTEQEAAPATPPVQKQRRVKAAYILIPLIILIIFTAGTASYLFLLPMFASADISISPLARTLHKEATLTIATRPKLG